jgi:hypothetical protein
MGAIAFSASAAPVTLSSTVDQSGFNGLQNSSSYPLTAPGTPYDFTGQGVANLTSITGLTITLTVVDGDTGPGDYDFNSLTLGLDGIDTGLKLNGFLNNQIMGLTLSGPTAAAILAALQADGKLAGSVLDATPGNSTPVGDIIGFPFTVQTTLEITGDATTNGGGGNPVPLPAAILLAPLGAGIAGIYSRRLRRQK